MTRPPSYPRAKWFAQRRNVRGRQRATTTRTFDELTARFLVRDVVRVASLDNPAFAMFRRSR